MSNPIPPVAVSFTASGDDAIVQAAKRVQAALDKTGQSATAAASGADAMAAGFRRAAQQLQATTPGAQAWTKGLQQLENQQTQATQAAARLNTAVHPIAAAMAQSASGSAKWEEGLRRLAAQQQASATVAKSQSTNALDLATSIRALAGSYAAVKVGAFVADALSSAAALHELAQRTGASVEMLSVLEFAGKRAGLSGQDVATAFRGLSLSLGQLRDGGSEAVATFQAIGLSAKDLQGLSVDRAFLKIVEAINRLPPGFDKAEVASRVFGRSGTELLALLDDLSNGGFARAEAEAKRFGAVVTGETAAAADNFTDTLGDMKGALGGLAREVLNPVLPSLTNLLKTMTELVAKGKEYSSGVLPYLGNALAQLIGLPGLFGTIGAMQDFHDKGFRGHGGGGEFGASAGEPPVTDKQIESLVKLQTAGRATAADVALLRRAIAQLNVELAKTTDPTRRAALLGQLDNIQNAIQRNPVRDANLAARKQAIQEGLTAEQQGLSAEAQLNEQQYAQGLKSLQDYFAERKQLAVDGVNTEMAALKQQLDLTENRPLKGTTPVERQADAVARQAEADAIRAQMAAANATGAQQINALTGAEALALKQLTEQRLQAEQEVQAAQGNTFQAALIGIQVEAQRRRELLAKDNTLSPADQDREVKRFQDLMTLIAQANEVQRQVNAEMAGMDRDRQQIQNQVITGKLSEKQGEEQIAALERQRLPTLQRLADEAMRLAVAVGDPALIEQAQALGAQLGTIAAQADLAGQRAAQFKADIQNAVGQGLTSLFTDGIAKLGDVTTTIEPVVDAAGHIIKDQFGNTVEKVTKDVYDLGDAFVDTARRIIQSIQQIAAQSLGNSIASVIFGGAKAVLTGGTGGAGGTFGVDSGGRALLGAATGGLIPGTGSGDTVPAMLTPGEFVINKAATARHFDLLAEINQGIHPVRPVSYGPQRFASGGLVTDFGGGTATVVLDAPEGWRGTAQSDDHTLRVIVRNRRQVRDILGGKA